jgi:hypothetical protein
MTPSDAAETAAETVAAVPEVPTTGVPGVDAVLGTLGGLEERAVAERVEVLERAHQELRRALDAADPA